MMQFFLNGGIFMIVILLLGLVTFTLNIKSLSSRESKKQTLIPWLIALTFFVGVIGTGIGLYSASVALPKMTASQLGQVIGIASTNVTFAAILAVLNTILGSIDLFKKAA